MYSQNGPPLSVDGKLCFAFYIPSLRALPFLRSRGYELSRNPLIRKSVDCVGI